MAKDIGDFRKVRSVGLSMVLLSALCPTGTSGQVKAPNTPTVTLDYQTVRTYLAGTKKSALLADFKCGSDGSLFLLMLENSDVDEPPLLYRLTPSGDVIRFSYTAAGPASGFRVVSAPARYFISESTASTLNRAQRVEPSDPSKIIAAVHVVMTYGYDGTLRKIGAFEPGVTPSVIGVFASGDLVIISTDKWTHESHFLIFDSAGEKKGELVIDTDTYHGADPASRKGPAHMSYVARVMTFSRLIPYGNDLLLFSPQTAFPILQLSERHGVVRSISLQLPEGKTISSVLPSNGRTILVKTGHSDDDLYALAPADFEKQKPYLTDDQILEFNASDGTLLRTIKFDSALTPVCNLNNEFFFLTSRPEDGRLQIIKGTLSY